MDASERDNILKEGVAYRRNTYRGQDITKYKTGTKINGRDLYQQISDCTFDDIYVGDYILSNQKDADSKQIKWLIADINNYRYSGDTPLTKCHVTIIPANRLATGRMNPTNDTTGGYANSEMATKTLPDILTNYVLKDFDNTHVLTYHNLLTTSINKTASNQYGDNSGVSNQSEWYSRQIDLMSEINVYGSTVWSSSGFDIGIDNEQYAIFRLRPELKYTNGDGIAYWYWLKTVASNKFFAHAHVDGSANWSSASLITGGIRPRFLID